MNKIAERRKAELNGEAEQYKEAFITGYTDMINNPGSLLRLGLQSGGLMINLLFPDKKNAHNKSSETGTTEKTDQIDDIEKKGMEWQFRTEYKEKLILVLLEILRQCWLITSLI